MARKLVKEMEDHKVSRGSRVSVRNRFTIFLCEDDFDRLSPSRDDLISKLERHLAKHVRSKRYEARKRLTPTGGVRKPSSRLAMKMIPRWTGSTP